MTDKSLDQIIDDIRRELHRANPKAGYRPNDAIKLIYAEVKKDCGRITPLMSRVVRAGILAELDKAGDRPLFPIRR